MPEFVGGTIFIERFMPRGHGFLWNPALLWLHVVKISRSSCAMSTKGSADSTFDRLRADPLCPAFDYQLCRVTCATFLANMPSFGLVNESRQLGHGIVTAQDFYVGRVRLGPEVKTLEEAYGI